MLTILTILDVNEAKHVLSSFYPPAQQRTCVVQNSVLNGAHKLQAALTNANEVVDLDCAALVGLSSTLSIPRGGSLQSEDDQTESLVITKVRNVIRSLLEIGDRKSPSISKLIRVTVGFLENLTGFELLPKKKKKSAKKKSKSDTGKKTKSSKRKKTLKSSSESPDVKIIPEEESTAVKQINKPKKLQKSASKPAKASSKNEQAHLSRELKATNPNYRIQRELKAFISSPPPNLRVNVGKNIRVWIITMTGAKNTIYEGEKYRLRVSFPPNYPTVPPSMYFLNPTPRHEHVYTNGDICLSLLGKDWRPTMTAQSLAMSILSILSSAREKSLPMDNARHAVNKPGQAQDDWVYHDDNC